MNVRAKHSTFDTGKKVPSLRNTGPGDMGPLEWSLSGLRVLTVAQSKWAHLGRSLDLLWDHLKGREIYSKQIPPEQSRSTPPANWMAKGGNRNCSALLKWPTAIRTSASWKE